MSRSLQDVCGSGVHINVESVYCLGGYMMGEWCTYKCRECIYKSVYDGGVVHIQM